MRVNICQLYPKKSVKKVKKRKKWKVKTKAELKQQKTHPMSD